MTEYCTILPPTEANLAYCTELLRGSDVVGVPTETVYGLAGNALDESSVRKIFEVKGRPFIDPLIVHFPSLEAAEPHVFFNKTARALAARFWPGALTLVLPKKPSIPDLVTAGLPSVAIRVPGHPVFHALLEQVGCPLAAPSANPFGYVSPTQAEHVQRTLGTRIPAVLDGGLCQHGVESTIVDLRDPSAPKILRPGPISAEDLGIRPTEAAQDVNDSHAQAAPGMLTQHYCPNTPITLFEHGTEPEGWMGSAQEAVLYHSKPASRTLPPHTYWLSESGDSAEAAHNLFRLIQKLDQANYAKLYVERARQEDIGVAVNDRLSRAAAKRLS